MATSATVTSPPRSKSRRAPLSRRRRNQCAGGIPVKALKACCNWRRETPATSASCIRFRVSSGQSAAHSLTRRMIARASSRRPTASPCSCWQALSRMNRQSSSNCSARACPCNGEPLSARRVRVALSQLPNRAFCPLPSGIMNNPSRRCGSRPCRARNACSNTTATSW
ncbi:hypothetical protein D3C71_1590920 [compost metagenome]